MINRVAGRKEKGAIDPLAGKRWLLSCWPLAGKKNIGIAEISVKIH